MNWYIRFLLSSCFFPGTLLGQTIVLKKLFHHKGSKSFSSIELGNVALYFGQAPKVETSMTIQGDSVIQNYFLPSVEVSSPECRDTIEKINKTNEGIYSIKVTLLNTPKKGINIAFTYPKQRVGMKYNRFESINLQKGLVFRLYNKELLEKMNERGKGIITTASINHPHVFIDCGHGGQDMGAVAFSVEKEVSLQVGLQLAAQLRKSNIMVKLSRDSDSTVPLDYRTTLANRAGAHLFISIHANSARSDCSGIETYFLSPSLLREDQAFLSTKEDQQLGELHHKKCNESRQLAFCVHDELLKKVRSQYSIKDRSVKQAVSQVLLGTMMPSILVEVGFVTHPDEGVLLSQPMYQRHLANGITSGILRYLGRA